MVHQLRFARRFPRTAIDSQSVMFQFERQGLLFCSDVDEEALFEVAIEGGASDVLPDKQAGFKVVADASAFGEVRDALEAANIKVDSERSGLSMAPVTVIEVCMRSFRLLLRRPAHALSSHWVLPLRGWPRVGVGRLPLCICREGQHELHRRSIQNAAGCCCFLALPSAAAGSATERP
jgi:hypothetical protein